MMKVMLSLLAAGGFIAVVATVIALPVAVAANFTSGLLVALGIAIGGIATVPALFVFVGVLDWLDER